MFDLNIFDEDHIEEPEEPEEPPPPTFSEEELEAARKQGYEKGRSEATQEARENREQFIAAQLEIIASTLPQIFKEEEIREKRYEEEVLHLAGGILKKLFPRFNELYGIEEILDVLSSILATYEGKSGVKIEVSEDVAKPLEKQLEQTLSQSGEGRILISPVKDIGPGSCRISWDDGGAVRNASDMATKIEAALEQLLAARGVKLGYSVNSDDLQNTEKDIPEESESVQSEDDGGNK